MNERLQKVLDYEKHLLEEREKLRQLVAESTEDSKLIRAKLDYFQKEINYMRQQVDFLKDEVIRNEIRAESDFVVLDDMPQEVIPQEVTPHKVVEQEAVAQETQQPVMVQFSDIKEDEAVEKEEQVQWQSRTSENKDLEKAIGKSLMGVFASILVFISLILFATAILPHFSEEAKMLTTYVVSFSFLIFGLYKWKKDSENRFYMALTACGVGALYISLLLSNMYFDAIGDIPLYIMIALWGLGVCFLCRIQTTLFQIIGHMGIFISVAFGCFLCFETDDTVKFTVLLVYYFVTMVMFFAVNPNRKISKNAIFHFFNALNCVVVVPSAYWLLGEGASLPMLLLLVFLLINIGVLLWSEADPQGVDFAIFSGLFLVLFWVVLGRLMADVQEETRGVCMYIVAMILWFLFEGKKFEQNAGKYITQACLLFMAVTALGNSAFCEEYMYVPLLVVPMVLVGYFRENLFGKYISLFLLFIYLTKGLDNTAAHFWIAMGAVILMYALMYIKKEQYQTVHKCLLHTLTIFVFWGLFSQMVDEWLFQITGDYGAEGTVATLTYLLVVLFHLIMMKTSLGCDLKTGERENPAYYNFVNMILMLVGLGLISDVENEGAHLLVILLALAVFMVNAKNLLDKRENIFAGIYVGIKFTILMIVILTSFEAVNYVISISCFLLAIVGIVMGFHFEYKALRLFGLILSMISTFKLIMVDISYENTLGNALSFFASGILCFVISLIYSMIDGKIGKQGK